MTTIEHIVAPEDVMAYFDGELPPERAEAIGAHVAACRVCQALAEDLNGTSDALRGWQVDAPAETLRSPVVAVDRAGRLRRIFTLWPPAGRHVAAAAFCVVAVGGAMWLAESRGARFALGTPPTAKAQDSVVSVALGGGRGAGGTAGGTREELDERLAALRARLVEAPPQVASVKPMVAARGAVASQQRAPAALPAPDAKIIRTVTLTIVTRDVSAVRLAIESLLKNVGGFVGTMQASGDGRSASLRATLRVPVNSLDRAVAALRGLGRVTDETQSGEDVSEQVRDLEARLTNSRNTEKRLTEVLRTRTGDVSDVLQVEREIARVRDEIERTDAERIDLERRVAYATITLAVNQERQATLDMGPLPLSARFRNAAVDGLRHAFESIVEVVLSALHVGPIVVLWLLVLWWPARRVVRHSRAWLRAAPS